MRLKAVVLLLLLAVLAIADYDKYLGRDLLFYAGATYRLKTAKVWQWTYSSTYPLVDGADFSSDKYHLYGYTGYSSKLKAIIVAMRGTVLSFKNLKTDLDYYQVTYPKNPSAKVHRSFYGGCKAIETALRQNLASITKKYPNAPIYVTGHSLGGALAVLSAA
jgi:predicted lipase